MENYVSFSAGVVTLQCMTKASVPELEREEMDLSVSKTFFIYLEVPNVDEKYKELEEKGFFPSSEPRDWPWGSREFALRDPDDYVFVFYTPSRK